MVSVVLGYVALIFRTQVSLQVKDQRMCPMPSMRSVRGGIIFRNRKQLGQDKQMDGAMPAEGLRRRQICFDNKYSSPCERSDGH